VAGADLPRRVAWWQGAAIAWRIAMARANDPAERSYLERRLLEVAT